MVVVVVVVVVVEWGLLRRFGSLALLLLAGGWMDGWT